VLSKQNCNLNTHHRGFSSQSAQYSSFKHWRRHLL